jgi:hypothetical protein
MTVDPRGISDLKPIPEDQDANMDQDPVSDIIERFSSPQIDEEHISLFGPLVDPATEDVEDSGPVTANRGGNDDDSSSSSDSSVDETDGGVPMAAGSNGTRIIINHLEESLIDERYDRITVTSATDAQSLNPRASKRRQSVVNLSPGQSNSPLFSDHCSFIHSSESILNRIYL